MSRQQNGGPKPPGDLGPALLVGQAGAAGTNVARLPQPHDTTPRPACQALAAQALDRARAALAAGADPLIACTWAFYAARLLAPKGSRPRLEVDP